MCHGLLAFNWIAPYLSLLVSFKKLYSHNLVTSLREEMALRGQLIYLFCYVGGAPAKAIKSTRAERNPLRWRSPNSQKWFKIWLRKTWLDETMGTIKNFALDIPLLVRVTPKVRGCLPEHHVLPFIHFHLPFLQVARNEAKCINLGNPSLKWMLCLIKTFTEMDGIISTSLVSVAN